MCTSVGSDPRDLGRWVWQHIGHPEHRFTTLISAYSPSTSRFSPTDKSLTTVLEQHLRVLPPDSMDPKSQLLQDLQEFIVAQQDKGDMIVLGFDANEDVR